MKLTEQIRNLLHDQVELYIDRLEYKDDTTPEAINPIPQVAVRALYMGFRDHLASQLLVE